MEFKEYLVILWRRKWIILTTIIMTEIVVIIGYLLALETPVYSASATLRIATAFSGVINYSDYRYTERLVKTYAEIATTKPVLDELKQRLELDDLLVIEVIPLPETELIQINVEHPLPYMAANIANTLSEILINQGDELYAGSGKSALDIISEQLVRLEDEVNQARNVYIDLVYRNPRDTDNIQAAKQEMDLKQEIYGTTLEQYEQTRLREALREKSISIVEPAVPPLSPSRPLIVLNIGLGFLISLVGGFGLVFLFEKFDTTLYTNEQIEDLTKYPNLGLVPNTSFKKRVKSSNGINPYNESFAKLRTSIKRLNKDEPLCTLLISSAEPRDGKSTIVSNLAFALARTRQQVIIIDCNLRFPRQHKIFNLPNETGLSNVLMERTNLSEVIQVTPISRLHVLTSGSLPRYPSELLNSPRMKYLITHLQESFNMILIDTPAVMDVTDAVVLAPQMDGVIMVVNRASSHKENVLAAFKQLENNKAKMIGYIINRAELKSHYYYQKQKTPFLKKLS